MQTVRDVAALRAAMAGLRAGGRRVALVPTMGALHAGHMALVAEARRRADAVVVSIFVNPTQFGANEDLDRYPRREATDAAMLEAGGTALLWAPDAAAMYPAGFATSITVSGVTERWDGTSRPGHFAGVATVVCKLLNQVAPDVALFGEKDFQQLATIRRMVADLDLPVEIVGVPTQREDDGVALSSRNAYLTPDERAAARALPRALGEAAAAIARGQAAAEALALAERRLLEAGFATVDYIALVDAVTLEPRESAPGRLLVAARIGTTRLIDNLAVEPDAEN
ncbi:pantoate--beta-alanine ligase [Sphingomonas jatrophae]|uniref:Pantothenate synthetase n=1 Tax=Sphingomonas jatrophae TaxID=1166337 RepID=A0A1I6LHR9_9SPHN|nr:pantoate--beta-alanine ligase [Sphingomonas jatrophae]SFS02946.1 pantothenate synthetase [Sphingomonas jatrophae]